MTNYKDFDIKKKTYSNEGDIGEKRITILPCISYITKEYCDPTNASGCTGCCNSQKNCPGSTGRRK